MVVGWCAAHLSQAYRPYVIDWCNDVNLMAHWALLFVYFVVLLLQVDATSEDEMAEQAYSLVLIVMTLSIPAALLIRVVLLLRNRPMVRKALGTGPSTRVRGGP